MTINIDIDKLININNHDYYFDDIIGEQWQKFKESIVRHGVINPIIISEDNYIISGYQRVRACKEIGINIIKATICDDIINDNDKLLMFIELNIQQRGNGNPNPIKMSRCIIELEKLYGIKNGNNQYKNTQCVTTQKKLAEKLDISVRTLCNYKIFGLKLIPQIQSIVSDGLLSTTTAIKYLSPLLQDDQLRVCEMLDKEHGLYTGSEIKSIINSIINDDELYIAINDILNTCNKYRNIQEIKQLIDYINTNYN